MADLKTGYLVHASPRLMFHAQIIGSFIGAFISSGICKLFTTIYPMPSKKYEAPLAHLWIPTARLAYTGTLPEAVWAFLSGPSSFLPSMRSSGLRPHQGGHAILFLPESVILSARKIVLHEFRMSPNCRWLHGLIPYSLDYTCRGCG
jgi:OPT oligopeptide transporter protein